MKKMVDSVGNKFLLIHYLKMHLKDNQRRKFNHNHNLKLQYHKINNINKHNNHYKIINKINKHLQIKIPQNNNKLLCINNKFNKFFLKRSHVNSCNRLYQHNNKRQLFNLLNHKHYNSLIIKIKHHRKLNKINQCK